MRLAVHLLLVAILAVFAASAGVGTGASFDAPAMQAADASGQIGMHMADCDECPAEQMQAWAQSCGSGCVAPALAVFGIRDFQSVFRPAAGFPLDDDALAGQIRQPELSPPRDFLS